MENCVEEKRCKSRLPESLVRACFTCVVVSFFSAGCGGNGPAEIKLTLSSESGDEIVVTPSGSSANSGLFGSSTINAEFFVVQRNRDEVDLSGSEVFVASEHVVNTAMREVRLEHSEQIGRLSAELSEAEEQKVIVTQELDAARSKLSSEYNSTRVSKPSGSRRASDLRKLLAASEQKAAEDAKYRALFAQHVAPLNARRDEILARISSIQSQMNHLRVTLPNRLFAALPESHATRFITDQNGKVRLKYSNQATAVVWCEEERRVFNTTERYRWLLRIPDDIDGSGKLMFTNATMLADGSSQLMKYGEGVTSSNLNN